jgi:hypothetical protein
MSEKYRPVTVLPRINPTAEDAVAMECETCGGLVVNMLRHDDHHRWLRSLEDGVRLGPFG